MILTLALFHDGLEPLHDRRLQFSMRREHANAVRRVGILRRDRARILRGPRDRERISRRGVTLTDAAKIARLGAVVAYFVARLESAPESRSSARTSWCMAATVPAWATPQLPPPAASPARSTVACAASQLHTRRRHPRRSSRRSDGRHRILTEATRVECQDVKADTDQVAAKRFHTWRSLSHWWNRTIPGPGCPGRSSCPSGQTRPPSGCRRSSGRRSEVPSARLQQSWITRLSYMTTFYY